MDCSVIIPIRNEYPQIIFTIDSIFQEFKRCGLKGEVIAVFNENTDDGYEILSKKVKLSNLKVLVSEEGQCAARLMGMENAQSEMLFFFDAHMLIEPFSFNKMISAFEDSSEKLGAGFFSIRYLLSVDTIYYGYSPLVKNFWGTWTDKKCHSIPYHMPLSGAAGYAIKRSACIDSGFYNKNFGCYGGGEPYLFYKLEMFGYTNFVNPDAIAAHLAAARGYFWDYDILYRNFLLASFILGGERFSDVYYYIYKKRCNGIDIYLKKLEEIYNEVKKTGEEDHKFVMSRKIKSVREVSSAYNYDNRVIKMKRDS